MRLYRAYLGQDSAYGTTMGEAISALLADISHTEKADGWLSGKMHSALTSMVQTMKPQEFLDWAGSMDMDFGLESKDLDE